MSEKKKNSRQELPPGKGADGTREVLLPLVESFRFQELVTDIVTGYGKAEALADIQSLTCYVGQAMLILEGDPPPVTSDQFWLLQLFYEFIALLPEHEEIKAEEIARFMAKHKAEA